MTIAGQTPARNFHQDNTESEQVLVAASLYRVKEHKITELSEQFANCNENVKDVGLHPGNYTEERAAAIRAKWEEVNAALNTARLEQKKLFKQYPTLKAQLAWEDRAKSNGHLGTDVAPPVSKPDIQITTDIAGMVNAAEVALMQLPGPLIFQRARSICQIAPAGPASPWLYRPPDAPIIAPVSVVSLREYGRNAATWAKYDKRAKTWDDAYPPALVFETLAERVQWKFPRLEAIISAPTLRPDGLIIDTQGYDQQTGFYLDFHGVEFPPIPQAPTRDDAIAALNALFQPFVDFPFAETSHSASLAAVLTLVGRFTIRGCVPAFAVRAHARGTGKGLLVNVVSRIATGRDAPTWTQTTNDDEEAKRMLSIAMAGDAVVHIDNVVKPFGSAKLDSAITSGMVTDRLLGVNINKEAPWNTVIFASGNNMTFVGDMVRRVVPIDLDSKDEHPENRSDFTYPHLLDWVAQERPRLLVAALTVLKAFYHADCPKQDLADYGSFKAWSDLIRHALVWCGFPDPCEGRENLEEQSDTSYEALAELLRCWADCYPDPRGRTLKSVSDDCALQRISDPSLVNPTNKWNDLHDALSAYDSKYDGKRLDAKRIGNALRTIEGRVLNGERLVRRGEYQHATLWKREKLK